MTAAVSRLAEPAADAAIAAATKTLQLPTIRAQAAQLAAAAASNACRIRRSCCGADRRMRRTGRPAPDPLVHEAKFPRTKRLADFDHTRIPDLTPPSSGISIRRLIDKVNPCGRRLRHRQNPSAHRAGHLAAEAGGGSATLTCAQLVNELAEAADDKQLTRVLGRHARLDLLCLDEIGYSPWIRAAPNCCSKSSPLKRNAPPSPAPPTPPSPNGATPSPTPD